MSALFSCCGRQCSECSAFPAPCPGCSAFAGRPYWLAEVHSSVCPLYECCVSERGLAHCGQCSGLPCRKFQVLKDPSLSDEEHRDLFEGRLRQLRSRKNSPQYNSGG